MNASAIPASGVGDLAGLSALVEAAVLAPSGDNTQPWRFVLDPDARWIEAHLDPSRDPSPMNAGQRMARIALGAAVENLLAAADADGWEAMLEDPRPPALARIALRGRPRAARIENAVAARVTNRRLYDRRPLDSGVLPRLSRHTPPLDGVVTHWIVEDVRLARLARVLARADAAGLSEEAIRVAFLERVRFEKDADSAGRDGMPVASLELSAFERFALARMGRAPAWLLKLPGAFRAYESRVRRSVESASGLCLIVAPRTSLAVGVPETDLAVGRALERAWVDLTREGLAAQPMMSLLVLENIADHGRAGELSERTRRTAAACSVQMRVLAPEIGAGRPAFLLRFGYAAPPTGRAGRLPPRF